MKIERILKKLDFNTVAIYNSICEEGSLSKAAEKNSIAISAASKRLSELEQLLETQLFVRESNGMRTTPAGESLYFYTRSILHSLQKASLEIGEYKKGLKGFIRLQSSLSALIEFLPDDLREFMDNNPYIKIEVEQKNSKDIINNIFNQQADLGICVVEQFNDELDYQVYKKDTLVLVAKDNAFFKEHGIMNMATALDYDFIGLQSFSSINDNLRDTAHTLNKQLKLRVLMSGFDSLCRMTQVGLGIGLIPKEVYEIFGKPLGLAYLDINEPWANRTLFLVSKPNEVLSPVSLALKNHLLSNKFI